MADKPRVKAPKQRTASADESARRRKTLTIVAVVGGLALGLAAVAAALGMVGGGGAKTDTAGLRTALKNSGCTLQVAPALEGAHSITDPSQTSPVWNTDPPTSGPHYAVAAIFGIYEDELEMARVVHDLEHGGIYILYGKDVPDATVEQLRAFYEDHKTGTIMAPLDRLGDKFALGAWVVDGDTHNGFLAKCTSFDEDSTATFFRSLQFRGPERFDPSQLQPGM
ncbi:MAG TPA: DUF3105 domain-containing protein [Gaiellaceae bacterium]|jgi:uncharacterized protein DUF3105|nr:DUF3105 domain-containing protein [Gaiellaceae bacterium]